MLVLFFGTALFLWAESGAALPWSKGDRPGSTGTEASGGGKESAGVMTQQELQSQVMSFADRFFVLIGDGLLVFEAQTQDTKALVRVRRGS